MMAEAQPEGFVRLQKAMANAGVASRRASEELIVAGRVKVNGKVVRELGSRIDPDRDQVQVDNRPVQMNPDHIYLAFNKPIGVVSSMADEAGRPDLHEYFIEFPKLFNVGRLDRDTSGLLLMTNDGDVGHALMHPSFEVAKRYLARVRGKVDRAAIQQLLSGVRLEDGLAQADAARVVDATNSESLVEVQLHSGRNRIVRRMMEAVGHEVIELTRLAFGPIRLDALRPGKHRPLTKVEVSQLLEAAQKSRS